MIVEGKGEAPPSPIRIKVARRDMLVLHQDAARQANYRCYSTGSTRWKRGLFDGFTDVPGVALMRSDLFPVFMGKVGEWGVALASERLGYRGLNVDSELRIGGDDGSDLTLSGIPVQVKTRRSDSSHSRQGVNLVRHSTERGRDVLPKAPAIVFAEYDVEASTVSVLGWLRTKTIRGGAPVPARKGSHFNVEVKDRWLEPLSSLVNLALERR